MKSYSEACERNKKPILSVIRRLLEGKERLLEIGSGNGQHAVYFSHELPHIYWQTSDREENHAEINRWIDDAPSKRLLKPLLLDVTLDPWPSDRFDAVFSANTTHIMSWEAVNDCFQCVANVLQKGGVFLLYGPFNYQGSFTSESNKSFDQHLKNLDSQMGIRDFEAINELAKSCGLVFQQDNKMPSNNRLLHFTKD